MRPAGRVSSTRFTPTLVFVFGGFPLAKKTVPAPALKKTVVAPSATTAKATTKTIASKTTTAKARAPKITTTKAPTAKPVGAKAPAAAAKPAVTAKRAPAAAATAKSKFTAATKVKATEAASKSTAATTTAKSGTTAKKTAKTTATDKVVAGKASAGKAGVATDSTLNPVDQTTAAAFTRRIVRPRDLLVLNFTFFNLKVGKNSAGNLKLTRRISDQPAYIIVGFPPQHVLEQAFFERATETPIPDEPPHPDLPPDPDRKRTGEIPVIPVGSRIAEPSRVVFRAPNNFTSLPYTLNDVLDACRDWQMSVSPSATPPDPRTLIYHGTEEPLPKLVIEPGSDVVNRSAAVKKAIRASTGAKTSAARLAATQALIAVTEAEAHNQWFAQRSPSSRGSVSATELEAAIADADTAKILPKLAEPTLTQTAIEAPTRLIISPNSYGAWVHAAGPVESAHSRRVELWHTRLAVRAAGGVTERDDFRRTIRAIWSRDVFAEDAFHEMEHDNFPFRAPLDAFDRHQIVHLSGNHRLFIPDSDQRVVPQPITVDRLMLSSLGAWMNIRGAWNPPPGLSLEEWRNRSTMGRDHYVRVVYAGRLYPFGHRASLIKVTERKFHPSEKGNAAFLRQRMFIVVREPFVLTGNTGDRVQNLDTQQFEQLNLKMPLKSARLTTLVTPNLDDPGNGVCSVLEEGEDGNTKKQKLFWPYVGSQPFRFHLELEDEGGGTVNVSMPLFFLGQEMLDAATGTIKSQAIAKTIAKRYTKEDKFSQMRRIDFSGQRVQFAPSLKLGDTSFEVSTLEFMLTAVSGRLVPGMKRAVITIPSLKHLARSQAKPEVEFAIPYLKSELANEFGSENSGEVFLKLIAQNATKMDFGWQGDRTGALVAPSVAINGLSRKMGPIGGNIDTLAGGSLNPEGFFGSIGDLLPKLFGCIKMTEILETDIDVDDLAKLPRFITENLTTASALLGDLGRMTGYLTTLQGEAPGLASSITPVNSAAGALSVAINDVLGDPSNEAKRTAFKNAFVALSDAAKTLRDSFGGGNVPIAALFTKAQLDQLLARFTVGLEEDESAAALAGSISKSLDALNEQRIKFEWKPQIRNWPQSGDAEEEWLFELRSGGGLTIAVELAAQSGSSKEPSFDVACRLRNFDLNLIAPETFIRLRFNEIAFTSSSRSKPDVNVDFDDIKFVGVLSFVETLRTLIPLDGFSDPPALEITDEGIEASFSLGIPTIAVGVFTLANLNLGAALTVPFVGNQPLSVRFNFCERSDPFRVTVWVFGGGGFFAVTITPAGCQVLEAAFEFGASVALDFGVASGSVSVMAGIYFKIETDEATLTGYFNVKGCVDVMGLISASIELNLELAYQFNSGKCVGRASLIIEVDVLLFSGSVEIECEKKFAGANGDPSFVQIMAPYTDPFTGEALEPWPKYCEAFSA